MCPNWGTYPLWLRTFDDALELILSERGRALVNEEIAPCLVPALRVMFYEPQIAVFCEVDPCPLPALIWFGPVYFALNRHFVNDYVCVQET
ncbi:hypothetical protein FKM82_009265 [Ascaphus truei]